MPLNKLPSMIIVFWDFFLMLSQPASHVHNRCSAVFPRFYTLKSRVAGKFFCRPLSYPLWPVCIKNRPKMTQIVHLYWSDKRLTALHWYLQRSKTIKVTQISIYVWNQILFSKGLHGKVGDSISGRFLEAYVIVLLLQFGALDFLRRI
jgi:hypothetical protein